MENGAINPLPAFNQAPAAVKTSKIRDVSARGRAFPSHGRDRRLNPYGAHQHNQLNIFRKKCGRISTAEILANEFA